MILITKGNQAVKITGDKERSFYSLHLVNAKIESEALVVRSARHATETGARKWAEKQLNA